MNGKNPKEVSPAKKRKSIGYKCAYRGCTNRTPCESKNLSFFRFPVDTTRSALWVESCGREDLKGKPCTDLHNNYRVCQEHFENKMFLNDLKNRLQVHAYPSLGGNKPKPVTSPPIQKITIRARNGNKNDLIISVKKNTEMGKNPEKGIQTEGILLSTLPKIVTLKKQNAILKTKIKRYKKKLANEEIQVINIDDIFFTNDQILRIIEKHVPPDIAELVKGKIIKAKD